MEMLHFTLFALTFLIYPDKTFTEEDKCEGLYPVFSPSSLVVRYGDPVSATCSVPNTTKTSMQYSGMGLEAKQGATDGLQENVMNLTWSVSSLTEWEEAQGIQCYSQFEEHDQCITNLSVTIYKPPDRVSLRFVSGSGPMVEGNQYQLECEVQSVAPVQSLTVKWFRGKTLLHESNVSQCSVTGHSYEGVTATDRYTITASREDHGVQYKCEAELKLDLPESLKYQSEPISIRISNHGSPTMISGRVTGALILFSLMDWL
ncbi:uncharacterized protein LOC115816933 isoform X2 [Chanos chanos]|uniref:Uncharacterized protein LOC115816933 isoform X2 n=1 Tax=Chanos chanos TaxID=29144 RepID=A0A6J2VVL6_CHACN|nr:uncharacterized protein LOC115816933 isoform X2 [Chanos chanos]